MKPRTRRILFSLAVLVWSAVLLYFHASGRINKYLAPDFRPIAFAGGLGLAVLGLFNLLTAGQKADCGHDHGDGEDAHDHESGDLHPLDRAAADDRAGGLVGRLDQGRVFRRRAGAARGSMTRPPTITTPFLASSMPR